MKNLSLVLLSSALLLTACKGKSDSAGEKPAPTEKTVAPVETGSGSAAAPVKQEPQTPGEIFAEAATTFTAFKDKMCACKDSACASPVNDAYMKATTDLAQKMGTTNGKMPDESAMKTVTESQKSYTECLTKAMTP